jgi:hypothetical protein
MNPADDPRPSDCCDGPEGPCPGCRALADRVAELERQLAEARGGARALPPFALKAMRLLSTGWAEGWGLRPSPARRHWMTENPHAYKCLPLVVANQWGWQVLCPTEVRVTWDGSPGREGLRVAVDPQYAVAVKSQFGSGIVTFSPPWLFRTPPGWDLYAKGPGNRWKPNCVPLEGVIETWWLNYTFTLNWKLVQPGSVTFARGESLGQLVPVPHGTFHGASAVEVPIETAEPGAAAEMRRWVAERERRANEPVNTHLMYRRAEEVEEHLVKVPIPPVRPVGSGPPPAGGDPHAP